MADEVKVTIKNDNEERPFYLLDTTATFIDDSRLWMKTDIAGCGSANAIAIGSALHRVFDGEELVEPVKIIEIIVERI